VAVNFDLLLILPETYQLLVITGLFCMTLAGRRSIDAGRWTAVAAGLGLLVTIASLGGESLMFYGAYKIDGVSQFFKLIIAFGFFIASLNAVRQPTLAEPERPDYFLLLAMSAWGLMLLSSSVELITIYIALEISSYSLYALIPLRAQNRGAAEAAIKYILFGAVATAVSLYGLGFILAGQHTSYIAELAAKPWSFAQAPMAALGLTLFLAGFFYKLALFPFHFWCPDVYDGSSNETAAYVATLPKLGAVVILVRLAAMLKPGLEITTALAVLGACSMTFGNLAALAQTDVKRILGFSSVAHAGYVMVGLTAATAKGLSAASFYIFVYVLMNLACFWVLCHLSGDGRNVKLDDLKGLHRRSPALAAILAVAAFSLVGLPPTAGFIGKFFLLTSAWNQGYNWLVIVATLNTAISIYYYLNLVRHAYTEDAAAAPIPMAASPAALAVGLVLAAAVLVVGVLPGPIFNYAAAAGATLLP
jgi:proton-translocating NADH-quinone oxidoreductase chain N